jgi:uncharacterized protein YjbJ (UPF0337 family)
LYVVNRLIAVAAALRAFLTHRHSFGVAGSSQQETQMTEENVAGQARKGLVDSVKGKAKELAGALTGNDSLTAEGQLEQAQARDRKEANSVEAIADAEAAQARDEATEARVEGNRERIAVNTQTAAVENSVRNEEAAQKRAAEQTAAQEATRAKQRAELEAQLEVQRAKADEREEISDASEEAVDAAAEHQSSAQVANVTHAEAERIREQAAKLTEEADLLGAADTDRNRQ